MTIEWNGKRYATKFDPLLLLGLSAFKDGDDYIISGFYDISKLKADHTYDLRDIGAIMAVYGKVTLDDVYVRGLIGKVDGNSSAINYEEAALSLCEDERLRFFCAAVRTLVACATNRETNDETSITEKVESFEYYPFKYLPHTTSSDDVCK